MAWVHLSSNANALIFTIAIGLVVREGWSKFLPSWKSYSFLSISGCQCELTFYPLPLTSSAFLRHSLPTFAAQNPQIEIRISPRPHKHPVIKGHYINGREKAICVRNLEKEQILEKATLLKEASGLKLKMVKKPVSSKNDSVRGIWSPYHGDIKTVWIVSRALWIHIDCGKFQKRVWALFYTKESLFSSRVTFSKRLFVFIVLSRCFTS